MTWKSLILLLSLSSHLAAQDERDLRKMLSGDYRPVKTKKVTNSIDKLHVYSKFYEVDLDFDNKVESIVIEKTESEDWVHIFDQGKNKLASHRLLPVGLDSSIFKIRVRQVAPDRFALLVYYHEGFIEYYNQEGIARLYMITYKRGDLKSSTLSRGPILWQELKGRMGHYHQRDYKVNFFDYNEDGVKEIAVKHSYIVSVFQLDEEASIWEAISKNKIIK